MCKLRKGFAEMMMVCELGSGQDFARVFDKLRWSVIIEQKCIETLGFWFCIVCWPLKGAHYLNVSGIPVNLNSISLNIQPRSSSPCKS